MTVTLRIVLIVASALLVLYTLLKIRKAQLDIDDTVFWLILPLILLIISIFPRIAFAISDLLGFVSPSNFILVLVAALLLFKLFLLSVELSVQKRRLNRLVQAHAISEEEIERKRAKDEEREEA